MQSGNKTESNKPVCVGIIMDGNRRWAKEHNLFVFEGHMAGYKKLKEVLKWSKEAGIRYLIVYAFSTENWKRKKDEVDYLMNLFRFMLSAEKESLRQDKIRVKCIGDIARLPKDLQKNITETERETETFDGLTLVACLSYGGRDEILHAIKKIAEEKKPLEIEKMTEEDVSQFLYTDGIPEPDLILRTSGEMRLSGFLPWQSIYSELFFTKTYWPDFTREEFDQILADFAGRKRRMGK